MSNIDVDASTVHRFLAGYGLRRPTLHFKNRTKGWFKSKTYRSPRAAAGGCEFFNSIECECYFRPNDANVVNTKAKKEDVTLVRGINLDFDNFGWDPDIPDFVIDFLDWKPFYCVFTGGGYQFHYRFEEPTPDWRLAEEVSIGVRDEFIKVFGKAGDNSAGVDSTCYNCDRVLRVPATLNVKRGAAAQGVYWNAKSRVPINELPRGAPPPEKQSVSADFDDWHGPLDRLFLCEVLPPWAYALLDKAVDVEGKSFRSRSHWSYALMGACIRAEVEPDLVIAVLVSDYPVAAHSFTRPDPVAYVRDQFRRHDAHHG